MNIKLRPYTSSDATTITSWIKSEFENNPVAINCYEAAGFRCASRPEIESYECFGETWNCIEMERYKEL